MLGRDAVGGQVVAAEMAPDQPERTEGLSIIAQGRAALVVVEDPRIGIIGAADVIDDAVGAGGDPFGRPAADQLRLRKSRVRMTVEKTSSA